MKKAVWISYWGVPIIVFVFVGTYWILGMENYLNPSKQIVVAEEEVEEEDIALMIVGMVGMLVVLLFCALWWFYPDISAKMQRRKKIGSQQTLVQSKTAFETAAK